MANPPKNVGASVRDRLLTLSRERKQPFDLLLTRYVLERLLYRLGSTDYRERFILKGAVLLSTWVDNEFRPTRDLDLLGSGDPDPDALLAIFKEIAAVDAADGVVFDPKSFVVEAIREETEYGGVRIKGNATVVNARVRVVIDIAFGDAIEPGVQETDLPVLLDFPAPKLRSYPRETVVAEKFQAMVALGLANSRLKDFYDVWVLIGSYKFEGDALARAIKATFARRKTEIPTTLPVAFTAAFTEDAGKKDQWAAFTKQVAVDPGPLTDVAKALAEFLMPRAKEALALEGGEKAT
ncbi:nucleotidyl transferase AbiEii/AbiGii toxin family protein [Bradyrhizobium sp. 14AA]